MRVLCILTKLPLPGSGDRKEGVYPVMLRAHVAAGICTTVAVHYSDNEGELRDFCESEHIRFVRPSTTLPIVAFLRYLAVRRTPGWAWFAWTYRKLLASIDRHIARHGRPDLIVGLQACSSAGRVAYLVGQRYRIPFAARENSTLYTRKLMVGGLQSTVLDVVKASWKILTVSQELGKNMERELGLAIPQKITMPNPVSDYMFLDSGPCRWIAQFAKSRFVFAGWTNWRSIKRIDIAIEAFAQVHAQYSQTCMIIAGPVAPEAQAMIDARGLGDAILLAGSLNRQGVRDLAHNCHCCIVTSDHDPGNNSVLEAMAAGKPTVVTRCGGSEDRITAPWLGVTVEPGNVGAFADGMRMILSQRDTFDRKRIVLECRSHYSEQAFARRLRSIYTDHSERLIA